jgi:hypothetical protein
VISVGNFQFQAASLSRMLTRSGDVLLDDDRKLAEAEAAGTHRCECGFAQLQDDRCLSDELQAPMASVEGPPSRTWPRGNLGILDRAKFSRFGFLIPAARQLTASTAFRIVRAA